MDAFLLGTVVVCVATIMGGIVGFFGGAACGGKDGPDDTGFITALLGAVAGIVFGFGGSLWFAIAAEPETVKTFALILLVIAVGSIAPLVYIVRKWFG